MSVSIPEPKIPLITNELHFNLHKNLPDRFSPLERMVLHFTGNLQRLLSAYFNVPTSCYNHNDHTIMNIDGASCSCNDELPLVISSPGTQQRQPQEESEKQLDKDTDYQIPYADLEQEKELDMLFHRKILIYFGNKYDYETGSLVSVKNHESLSLLAEHKYGLGQIISHLHYTPKFFLKSVGCHGNEDGRRFWRDYT
ncbi:hypothetical protein BDA99DRAFT_540900 [Phascolomyces articulosus]|uniref:Uncharacterized protein n=1 Tax=Phascolomyces articulosus TaxID=60185 RepID=A0AAD5JSW3_9FUNG|nr:hypothetical protein BDA99DRAFT_540900 [Phascolomyces articulosus]